MIIKTLFESGERHELGEVEVRLLPGIPALHVVGMPDSHIREFGIKLKAALRACGLKWPRGHQIVVNLRPSYFRKSSSGVDLAIALGFLCETEQLPAVVIERLRACIVYGELALDGRVFAPRDFSMAVRAQGERYLLTGTVETSVREGRWHSVEDLRGFENLKTEERTFDWPSFWRRPEPPPYLLHEKAAQALWLAVHAGLSVLVAGPQGSGKTTWAHALHALTPAPDLARVYEGLQLFGDSFLESRWRPLEQPHHSIPALSMIGGGVPLEAGVISRAHGGVLLMDEFLEFNPRVLEALREPVESGYIYHSRRADRARFPASFQLIGTANLCPCGKLNPAKVDSCSMSLTRCRSVCARLSGPVMDRFDWLIFSHNWLGGGRKVEFAEVLATVEALREFAIERGVVDEAVPEWMGQTIISHRRRRSILKVARALADYEREPRILPQHFQDAFDLVVVPMQDLAQLFG